MNQPNSEDDTYRKLMREPDFKVVKAELEVRIDEHGEISIVNLNEVLAKHHWTEEEYLAAEDQYSEGFFRKNPTFLEEAVKQAEEHERKMGRLKDEPTKQ